MLFLYIEKVYNGFKPIPKHNQMEAYQKLNITYKKITERINYIVME